MYGKGKKRILVILMTAALAALLPAAAWAAQAAESGPRGGDFTWILSGGGLSENVPLWGYAPERNVLPSRPADADPGPKPAVPVTGVSLDPETAALRPGEKITLTAAVTPEDADDRSVTWESSDPSAATVEDGVVTALGEGEAVITVTTTDGGFTASCAVSVTSLPDAGILCSGRCGAGLDWTLYADGVLEIAGTGSMWNYDNAENPAPWRAYSGDLVTLVLKEGITAVGRYAFYECRELSGTLRIPDGVTAIRESAFGGCTGFTGALVLPDSVTETGAAAFQNCKFDALTLSRSLTAVGTCAFNGALRSTASPSETLTIPAGVKSIGVGAFAQNDPLLAFEVEDGNGAYCCADGILYTADRKTLVQCPSGKSGGLVILPETETVMNMAFVNCRRLTGPLVIPDGVTAIGDVAFARCSGFTGMLTLGENVTRIGLMAFQNCRGLTGLVIFGDRVSTIRQNAFQNCSGIREACFSGDAPAVFGAGVFDGCAGDFTIVYLRDKTGFDTPEWNGYPCYPADEVPKPVSAAGVSLDQTSASLAPGDTLVLTASVTPDDAYDKSVRWESSDPAVASVEGGVVTALTEGTATITATTADGGFTASCAVTVKKALRGDMNGDGALTSDDAIRLLRHTMNPDRYPVDQSADMNGDGEINSNDAIRLLRHTMNPDRYPLS